MHCEHKIYGVTGGFYFSVYSIDIIRFIILARSMLKKSQIKKNLYFLRTNIVRRQLVLTDISSKQVQSHAFRHIGILGAVSK